MNQSASSAFSDRSSSRPTSSRWKGATVLLIVLVLLGAGIWAASPRIAAQFSDSDEDRYSHLITEAATKGAFLVTANVQGNLDSQGNSIMSSAVEGTTTIITIVPEGSWVDEGDVVCVLDSAMLVDMAKTQEIVVTNADAAEAQAKEQLEVARAQGASDIAAAELALTLADLDLEKYIDGEFPKLQNELKGNVALALEEAVQSEETYEFTKRLVKKGYKNQNELEAARIQVEKTKLAVQKAEEELKVLEKYEKKRTIAELEANAEEFVRVRDRAKLTAKAAEVQAEQAYEAARKSAELEREKLAKLLTQIENCTLIAPQSGEVVYANLPSQSRRGGGDGPAIEEGAEVRERQPIINLPDVTKMKVDSRVHESLIGYLQAGLPAKVRVDAYPDEFFKAKVATVSSVPMTGRWPNYDLREYEVIIHLTDEIEKVKKLRPGLTAQVEVLVNSRQNVLQVPVQSVIGIGGKYFAFVLKKGGPERRELKIGETNQTDIEIIDGVAESEQVVMNPRTHFAEEIAELASILGAERNASMTDDLAPGELPPTDPAAGPASLPGAPGAPGQRRPPGEGAPAPGAGGPQTPRGDATTQGGPNGGAEGGPRRGGDPAQMFARMDANQDGMLSKDEVRGGMADRFAEIDSDSNGSLTSAEVAAWGSKNRPAGGAAPPAAEAASPAGG
jgi:HlyD family secretion protein